VPTRRWFISPTERTGARRANASYPRVTAYRILCLKPRKLSMLLTSRYVCIMIEGFAFSHRFIYRLPLRTRYSRKLNTDGPHRLTPSSSSFLWIVTNISHLFMLKLAVQQSTFIHSGRSTMHYGMRWIQMPFVALRSILPKGRTYLRAQMEVSPFITSAPVNSA